MEPNISGIGHCIATFEPRSHADFSSLVGHLKLPLIQHTVRLSIDGQRLHPEDPVKLVVPLKDLEKGKQYELRIESQQRYSTL
jgi:hypothetical protein